MLTLRPWLTAFASFVLSTATFAQTATIHLADATLVVDVADTARLQEKGLQGIQKLPQNRGMLFVFDEPKRVCFWMKNTPLALDIGFFDEQQRLIAMQAMTPNTETLHCAPSPIAYALEVNRGWFTDNEIKKGTRFAHVPEK